MTAAEVVKRESKSSETSKHLFRELKRFMEDDIDSMCGIFLDLINDEERQLLLDYIKKGEDVNEEQLILTAIWIAQQNGH